MISRMGGKGGCYNKLTKLSSIYKKYLLWMYYKLIALIMNYYNYKIFESGVIHSVSTCIRTFNTCGCHVSCWLWVTGQNLIPFPLEG